MPESLLIVSGESSGELYGALLAKEIRARYPDIKIFGVGGERMRAEGVDVTRTVSGAFGLSEALSHLKELRVTFKKILEIADQRRPKLAVLIDFPDFNFKLGKALKRRGIKILYYVSPQIWAWRAGRVRQMARFVDRMAVILPFEEPLYRKAGISCEFVGHPVLDEIESMAVKDKASLKRELSLEDGPYIAILPGSRPSELKRHLPILIETLKLLKREFPEYGYILPLAPNLDTDPFKNDFEELKDRGVLIRKESALKMLAASEGAVIASGTATLQAAFLETPFVVIYKLSRLTYLAGRLILRVKYVTLLNIILGRESARELLQEKATPENIVRELGKILKNQSERGRMLSDFRELKGRFGGPGASRRVADMAAELAGWR